MRTDIDRFGVVHAENRKLYLLLEYRPGRIPHYDIYYYNHHELTLFATVYIDKDDGGMGKAAAQLFKRPIFLACYAVYKGYITGNMALSQKRIRELCALYKADLASGAIDNLGIIVQEAYEESNNNSTK